MPEVELQHDGHPAFRRQVRFDWSNLPVHWVPGDPFVTHMINVLHLLHPLKVSATSSRPSSRPRLSSTTRSWRPPSNLSFSRSLGCPGQLR